MSSHEPGKLDQDRAGAVEHEVVGIVPGDLAREHLPAAPEVEPPGGDLAAHLRERLGVEAVALDRPRVVIPGRMRVRRREQDLGAGLVGEAAELEALLDRGGTVVARRDNVRVDVDETGHASTIAAASPPAAGLQRGDEAADALDRLLEVLERRGVRDAEVAVAVARRTRCPRAAATPASSSSRSASSSAPIGSSDTFGNA